MAEITITENGETAGRIDTDAGSAEYSGDNPIVAGLIEDLDEGSIFTTTHDGGVTGGDAGWGSTLPPDRSEELTGEDLAEYVRKALEMLGVDTETAAE